MLKPPCKDCRERHYICHADCPKYLEYLDAKKDLDKLIRLDNEFDQYCQQNHLKVMRYMESHKRK